MAEAIKENYQKRLDGILAELDEKTEAPRLLLQSCCGPCSSYVLEYLTRYFSVTVLFYNPNIQPESEYRKRLENQIKLINSLPVKNPVSLLSCDYDGDSFTHAVRGLESEPEGGARCAVCFRLRLEETARLAQEGSFDFFCTTLSVSPHKNAQLINLLGYEIAEKYGVNWLPCDFKKKGGYLRSIELSRQYELYRQNYCGCLYSKTQQNNSSQ